MNANPMYFNESYAAESEFGDRLPNGTFIITLAVGMSVIDVSKNATANLRYDDIRHYGPASMATPSSPSLKSSPKQEVESREHVEMVTTELHAHNEDNDLMLSLEQTPVVLKRKYAKPSAAQQPDWPEDVRTQPGEEE